MFTSGRIVPLDSDPHEFRPRYRAHVTSDPGVCADAHAPSNSQGFGTAVGHRRNLSGTEGDGGVRRAGALGNIRVNVKPTETTNCGGHDDRDTVNCLEYADEHVPDRRLAENEAAQSSTGMRFRRVQRRRIYYRQNQRRAPHRTI